MVHPSCGLANRCTAPVSLALPSSPIATILPSAFTATDDPKALFAAPSCAVSTVDVAVVAHPPSGSVNTYAAPVSPPTPYAPTTTVLPSPLIATLSPKSSLPAGFSFVSFAAAADDTHPPDGRVNTYAPESAAVDSVPTTIVSPFALTDTTNPNLSSLTRGEGVSSTLALVSTHPVAGFVNTYTAPRSLTPPASTLLAPTTIVLPSALTATEYPNSSPSAGEARVSFASVADVDHPPDGRVNTYAAPPLLTPPGSSQYDPATTVLPSPLTATLFPKKDQDRAPDPTSLTPVGTVPLPHPPGGLVYTNAAPMLKASRGAPTTTVLSSALTAAEVPNPPVEFDRKTFSLSMIGGPYEFSHEPEPAPPEDDAPKTPPSPSVAEPATIATTAPRMHSATTDRRRMNISSPPVLAC